MKKKETQNYKTGDVFSFQIAPNEFGYGRVLLDVYNHLYIKKIIDKNSALLFGNKNTILIEIYKYTSSEQNDVLDSYEVLIPGLFTSNIDILLNYWIIIGNKPVDYNLIDFPEFLSHKGAFNAFFIKGEVRYPISISYEEVERIKIYSIEFGSSEIPEITLCSLGRFNEINNEISIDLRRIENYDLRFNKNRNLIYTLLPSDFKNNYCELSRIMGFDITRFKFN